MTEIQFESFLRALTNLNTSQERTANALEEIEQHLRPTPPHPATGAPPIRPAV